jgi:hypothetical protein
MARRALAQKRYEQFTRVTRSVLRGRAIQPDTSAAIPQLDKIKEASASYLL